MKKKKPRENWYRQSGWRSDRREGQRQGVAYKCSGDIDACGPTVGGIKPGWFGNGEAEEAVGRHGDGDALGQMNEVEVEYMCVRLRSSEDPVVVKMSWTLFRR